MDYVHSQLNKYTTDELQFFISQASAMDVSIHQHISTLLDYRLVEMEYKGKVCLTPLTILNIYSKKFNKVAV